MDLVSLQWPEPSSLFKREVGNVYLNIRNPYAVESEVHKVEKIEAPLEIPVEKSQRVKQEPIAAESAEILKQEASPSCESKKRDSFEDPALEFSSIQSKKIKKEKKTLF